MVSSILFNNNHLFENYLSQMELNDENESDNIVKNWRTR